MSSTLKINYLRALRHLGKTQLVTKSVFGFPYRIALGDFFSENPFYNSQSNVGEILATAAWASGKQNATIFDIGAHCGFISSQLAFILRGSNPNIFSFEPVPPTFSDLVQTIKQLSLQDSVHPIAVALSDVRGIVQLNYSKVNSMLAQIIPDGTVSNMRSGDQTFFAPAIPMDDFIEAVGVPDVIKIDVEGWEVHVMKGAKTTLLQKSNCNTGVCMEWNPEALQDTGSSINELYQFFTDYRFFYINDYEGQRLPELSEVKNPLELAHVCNFFLIHKLSKKVDQWKENFTKLKNDYRVKVS